jgi:hypothetical protein
MKISATDINRKDGYNGCKSEGYNGYKIWEDGYNGYKLEG